MTGLPRKADQRLKVGSEDIWAIRDASEGARGPQLRESRMAGLLLQLEKLVGLPEGEAEVRGGRAPVDDAAKDSIAEEHALVSFRVDLAKLMSCPPVYSSCVWSAAGATGRGGFRVQRHAVARTGGSTVAGRSEAACHGEALRLIVVEKKGVQVGHTRD